MNLTELVEQTKLPGEYLVYLKGILDGAETNYTEEDVQQVEELEGPLNRLCLDDD